MKGKNMASKGYLRVSEAADLLKVTPQTIRKYKNKGIIKGYPTPGGQTLYSEKEILNILNNTTDDEEEKSKNYRTVYYARASDGDKQAIENQYKQLEEKFGKANYYINDKASGLNEKRKGLRKLFELAKNNEIDRIIITQKDRLTRFGYPYLEEAFNAYDVELIAAFEDKEKTMQEELMQDFMSLIASFSGKFYRMRGYAQQKKLLDNAEKKLEEKINASQTCQGGVLDDYL